MPVGPLPTRTSWRTELLLKLTMSGPVRRSVGMMATLSVSRFTTNTHRPDGSTTAATGPWMGCVDSGLTMVEGGKLGISSGGGRHWSRSSTTGSPLSVSKVMRPGATTPPVLHGPPPPYSEPPPPPGGGPPCSGGSVPGVPMGSSRAHIAVAKARRPSGVTTTSPMLRGRKSTSPSLLAGGGGDMPSSELEPPEKGLRTLAREYRSVRSRCTRGRPVSARSTVTMSLCR